MRPFEAEWRARFERFGRNHTEEHYVSGWSAEGLARRLGLFERLMGTLPLAAHARSLDLGCGAGTYVRRLATLGHTVVGVDYALPSLSRALAADPVRRGRYMAADGYQLPFVSGCFDLVLCVGVLQALSQPEQLLDEISRILRPRGVVVVEALNALELPSVTERLVDALRGRPPRVRRHTSSQVSRWLEARGIQPLRRAGVYLPPRALPGVGWVLDWPGLIWLLEEIPGASTLTAHAFWHVGRKSA